MDKLDNYDFIDLNYAVEKEYALITAGKSPVENPKAYILGGQPGSGKSTLQNMIGIKSPNTVMINGDEYRSRHPNYEKIYEVYSLESANHTQSFANAVANALTEKLSNDGYNIVIEGTCRRPEVPLKTCNDLKEKGYEVELMIMCCDKNVAWLSTIDRYNRMKEQGKLPRAVPIDKFRETVTNLSSNIDELYHSGAFDEITLYNRHCRELYRMTDTPDKAPGEIIYRNLNRESELHFGLLGNGVTVYDVSRFDSSINDYPTVAHISPKGKLTLYDEHLLRFDLEQIKMVCKGTEEQFKSEWNNRSETSRYSELLERASTGQLVEIIKSDLSMGEKVKKYEDSVIFGKEEFPSSESIEKSATMFADDDNSLDLTGQDKNKKL